MPIDLSIVGTSAAPIRREWDADDVMLYAVGCGAGALDPTEELDLTTENTPERALRVLPTFAYLLTRGLAFDFGDIDPASIVHAEQSFVLHAPIPEAGSSTTVPRVTAIDDMGSAAMITVESTAVDEITGAPLATGRQRIFVRGEGGWGGTRPLAEEWSLDGREPDETISLATRPEQALIYRLSGDRNPLHTDPGFAARAGFDRPILHGMCVYGFAGRAIVSSLCDGDPALVRSMTGRFTSPVFPGEPLTVRLWRGDDGEARFRVLVEDRIVLDRGACVIGPVPDSNPK